MLKSLVPYMKMIIFASVIKQTIVLMKRIFLLFFCVLMSLIAFAQEPDVPGVDPTPTTSIDELLYKLNDATLTAMVANGNSWVGNLTIPERVIYNGKTYTVDRIEWLAFDNCETLTKVTIPNTICGISSISVDPNANKNPFVGCTNLESIEVAEDNPAFSSVEGVLYDKEMTMLCSYPAGAKRKSYTVPEGIKAIGGCAFSECPYLVNIQLPQAVSTIYHSAFSRCEHLETVNIPAGIIHLSAMMFGFCVSLKDIVIPDGVKTIAEKVFYSCTSLRKIEVPASVYLIGGLAFRGCTLDALVIRGHISEYLTKDVFAGLDVSTPLYVPASEVARYQSVYSGTVLPLESYQAQISLPELSTGQSLSYDLEGRRLQGRPAKGLYIENGRKRIVR